MRLDLTVEILSKRDDFKECKPFDDVFSLFLSIFYLSSKTRQKSFSAYKVSNGFFITNFWNKTSPQLKDTFSFIDCRENQKRVLKS